MGLKGKITLIFFLTNYLSLQWLLKSLNDDDAGIAAQVDLKTSTLKPLHANWVINNHNLLLNAQNYLVVASDKWGYYLIIDTINNVHAWLFIISIRSVAYHSFFHQSVQ